MFGKSTNFAILYVLTMAYSIFTSGDFVICFIPFYVTDFLLLCI